MDSTLTYNKRLWKWTFNGVYGKDVMVGKNQAAPDVAAFDPGVVNFLTWHSPSLGSGSIGNRDIEQIIRLCLHLDSLIAKTDKARCQKKNSHRRAQARVRKHIQDLIDKVHIKVALWAVRTFDILVLPEFGAKRMSLRKSGRRLHNKWAHARFRQQLL